MPELGVPSSAPRRSTHTSTQQWQSFETKMRHRRAERCLANAEAALEAGLERDARAALAEAKALKPESPEFEQLRESIRQRRAVREAAAARSRSVRHWGYATAALLIAAVGAGGLWLSVTGPEPLDVSAAPTITVAPPPPQPAGTSMTSETSTAEVAAQSPLPAEGPEPVFLASPIPSLAPPTPSEETKNDPVQSPVVTSGRVDRLAETPAARILPPPAAPVPAEPLPPVRDVEVALMSPRPSAMDAIGARAPAQPVSIDRLAGNLPSAALPVPAAPARAPEPVAESEEPKVRAVLARFESAYSGLDAQAAQAVWPDVDTRSLARAFQSLESQRVSLGRCSISLNGPSAHAECFGSTTWTPKVGGGARTEARRWQFELAGVNGAWRIVRAQAR